MIILLYCIISRKYIYFNKICQFQRIFSNTK
nr:MAG TPA: hypothetical protein [Caudoviricetes sp.]